jgi:hypothetical protein
LSEPTCDAQVIGQAARQCLQRVVLDRKVRLLGVRVTDLVARDSLPPHRSLLDY